MWSPTRAAPSESDAEAADRDHDRFTGRERRGHRRAALGLHADHPDAVPAPGRDPGERPAAADAHQHRVDVGHLLLDLDPERPLTGDHLGLIERVHHQRTGLSRSRTQRLVRLGEVPLDDRHGGTMGAHAIDLRTAGSSTG